MHRTRWTTVLACFVAPTALAWVAADLTLRHRGWVPSLTPWGAAVAVLVSVGVLVGGLAVRRMKDRQPTWITPTGAAATAAAAQASALVAPTVGGIYAGSLIAALLAPTAPAMTSLAWSSGACLAACALWCGIGLLVEHWCAIDLDDDDDDPGAAGTGDEVPA
ncbi:DUF3180 family protein [Actinomyces howellii]|uniref:Protein of uncharacterized function (DUF3180) n=1 Tax=Actinomyces howellii TaxID=52771 RepID=A0A3S4RFD5_9ACTO|nr:DUF3180 family protein [Actinomyces howellii]VEG27923.1 Protein of uncharacterised function (DUF3180) [Actinomyces howellii]